MAKVIDAGEKTIRAQKAKAAVRAYLVGKGLRAADIDRELDAKSVGVALLALHGVTPAEYRAAGGVN